MTQNYRKKVTREEAWAVYAAIPKVPAFTLAKAIHADVKCDISKNRCDNILQKLSKGGLLESRRNAGYMPVNPDLTPQAAQLAVVSILGGLKYDAEAIAEAPSDGNTNLLNSGFEKEFAIQIKGPGLNIDLRADEVNFSSEEIVIKLSSPSKTK